MTVRCAFCDNETNDMSTSQAASVLQVSEESVRKRARTGRLHGSKRVWIGNRWVWRIPSDIVIALHEENYNPTLGRYEQPRPDNLKEVNAKKVKKNAL